MGRGVSTKQGFKSDQKRNWRLVGAAWIFSSRKGAVQKGTPNGPASSEITDLKTVSTTGVETIRNLHLPRQVV